MKLYIYDHCPFCVRARMIFGLRGVEVENIILANDDEDTPIGMIGAKQVPILEKDDGTFMGESLDIVHYIDETAGKGRLKTEVRPELQAWLDKVGEYNNRLAQPRLVKIGLPEFATESAIQYFIDKKEKNIGNFETNLNETAQNRHGSHPALPGSAQPHRRPRRTVAGENRRLLSADERAKRRTALFRPRLVKTRFHKRQRPSEKFSDGLCLFFLHSN